MTTKPDVPMNDEQIWCSHIITRYELGNTYCAKCHLWLYAGYEKAEAKPEPSTGAREMDPREFVLRNYGHQHESEYYSSEIYNAMKLFAEYIHQSRMNLVAQEAAREIGPLGVLHNAQKRVVSFTTRCFGDEQTYDPKIRALRLVEEAIEMCQAVGVESEKIGKLTEYVYGKEAGKPDQELGGIALTALAMATSLHRSFENAMLDELERVESKTTEHFAKRNQVKIDLLDASAIEKAGKE